MCILAFVFSTFNVICAYLWQLWLVSLLYRFLIFRGIQYCAKNESYFIYLYIYTACVDSNLSYQHELETAVLHACLCLNMPKSTIFIFQIQQRHFNNMLLQTPHFKGPFPLFTHIQVVSLAPTATVDSIDASTLSSLLAHNYRSNWITAFAPENMATWINDT